MTNIRFTLFKVKFMLLVNPRLQWQYEGAKSLLNQSTDMLLRAASFSQLQGSSQYCITSLPVCVGSMWVTPVGGHLMVVVGVLLPGIVPICHQAALLLKAGSCLSGGRSHIPKVFLEIFSFNKESLFYGLLIYLILYLSWLMRLIIIKSWTYSLISAEIIFLFLFC